MKTHKPVIGRLMAVNEKHEPIYVMIDRDIYSLALRYEDFSLNDLGGKLKGKDIRLLRLK